VKTGKGFRKESCSSPILSKLYSQYFSKEALAGFEYLRKVKQLIHTVKYAGDLMLLSKEKTVLQDRTDRLTEIGRCK
jgi:hypothetical protein